MTVNSPQSELNNPPLPRVDAVTPTDALPLGEVELTGVGLGPLETGLPEVVVDGQSAHLLMCRPTRLTFQLPAQTSAGLIEVRTAAGASNAAVLNVARQLADGLHPVTSPAVSRAGMIYATISGQRGKPTPISIVRVSPDGQATPFVTGILNATGLAFSPEGDLYATSRAEGTVYRIDAEGKFEKYAEGMGVATGAAFDAEGNLFVGDRSGTIFKINPQRQIFVHSTVSSEGDIYLAACLHGRRGLVRVTPQGKAALVLAANDLVGIAFSPEGTAILATHDAVYEVDLGIKG